MASIESILFHGYIYGTAFWYSLRGACRVYDPAMVAGWFRPPAQLYLHPNDMELYNIKTDAWCLITLGLLLVGLTGAVPTGSSSSASHPASQTFSSGGLKNYARIAVVATVFHHITTAYGAYQHYKLDTHYNAAMGIGVWANAWLTLVGLVTLIAMGSGSGKTQIAPKKAQ